MNGNIGRLKVALLVMALTLSAALLVPVTGPVQAQSPQESQPEELGVIESGQEFPVPVKPLPKTITPCRACHGPEKDFPVQFKRHEDLLVHKNIKLAHGGTRVWCLDCHNADNRNFLLPLSDGRQIDFEHSYLLCGKCHGTKYRDWRYGIHGKRVGNWNGQKEYFLCVNCHNPHLPKFKPLEPMPPPEKPWTPKETQVKH